MWRAVQWSIRQTYVFPYFGHEYPSHIEVGEAVVSVSGCQRKPRGVALAGVVARLRPALWRRGCV